MAATYYADGYRDPDYSVPHVGVSLTKEFLYTIVQAWVIDDLFKLAHIPAGVIVTDYFIDVPDVDTSTGFVCDVGDNADDDHFILGSTVGQAVGFLTPSGTGAVKGRLPKLYAAANDFVLHVDTAATGTAATTGVVKGWLRYHYYGYTRTT